MNNLSFSVSQNEVEIKSYIKLFLSSIHPLSEQSLHALLNKLFYLHVEKGTFIRTPDHYDHHYYFIIKGVVRSFTKNDHQEITTWINAENNIIGTIQNLGGSGSSNEYLQALEDTELMTITANDLEQLYEEHHEINTFSRKLLEIHYRNAEERALLSRLPSAEKRYTKFVQDQPSIAGRIPLRYLASYLVMKEETLCRIRAKSNSNKQQKIKG